MKLTVNQLRRIIKEEVQKVIRASKKHSLREAFDPLDALDGYIEIPDVTEHAEGADMDVPEFVREVQNIAKDYKSFFDFTYSKKDDTIGIEGYKSELKSFALELDRKFIPADRHGGGQSIEAYFTQFIQDYDDYDY